MGELGDAIRKAREEIGFTQDQLGKLIHYDESTVGRWESEKRTPNCAQIRDVVQLLLMSVNEASRLMELAGCSLSTEDRLKWTSILDSQRKDYEAQKFSLPEGRVGAFRFGSHRVAGELIAGEPGSVFRRGDIVVDVDKSLFPCPPPDVNASITGVWEEIATKGSLEDAPVGYLHRAVVAHGKLHLEMTDAPWHVFAVLRRPALPRLIEEWKRENQEILASLRPLGVKLVVVCASMDGDLNQKLISKVRPRRVLTNAGQSDVAVSGYFRVGKDGVTADTVDSSGNPSKMCPFVTARKECWEEAGFFPVWNDMAFFGIVSSDTLDLTGMIVSEDRYWDLLGLRSHDFAEGVEPVPEPERDRPWEDAFAAFERSGLAERWAHDFTPEAMAAELKKGKWRPGAEVAAIQALLHHFDSTRVLAAFSNGDH